MCMYIYISIYIHIYIYTQRSTAPYIRRVNREIVNEEVQLLHRIPQLASLQVLGPSISLIGAAQFGMPY